jgi:hypothetical protein
MLLYIAAEKLKNELNYSTRVIVLNIYWALFQKHSHYVLAGLDAASVAYTSGIGPTLVTLC